MKTKTLLPISFSQDPNAEVSLVQVVGTKDELFEYDYYLFVLDCAILAQMTKEEIRKVRSLVSILEAMSYRVSVELLNPTMMDATQYIAAFGSVLCFDSVTQAVSYNEGRDCVILKIFIGRRIYLGIDNPKNHIVSIGLKDSPCYGISLESPSTDIVNALISLVSTDRYVCSEIYEHSNLKMFLPFVSLNMPREFIRVSYQYWNNALNPQQETKTATAADLERAKKICRDAKAVYRGEGTPKYLCISVDNDSHLSLLFEKLLN